jgi:hypothetical protein
MNIGVHKQEQNIIGQKQPGISRRPLVYGMREPVGHVLSKINNDPTGQGWYIHSCEGEYKLGPIEMLKIAIWITNRWVDELLKIEQWGITLTVPMAFVMPDDWNHTSIDWDEKTLSGQNSRVARRCLASPIVAIVRGISK